jgi:hypothetical protein
MVIKSFIIALKKHVNAKRKKEKKEEKRGEKGHRRDLNLQPLDKKSMTLPGNHQGLD